MTDGLGWSGWLAFWAADRFTGIMRAFVASWLILYCSFPLLNTSLSPFHPPCIYISEHQVNTVLHPRHSTTKFLNGINYHARNRLTLNPVLRHKHAAQKEEDASAHFLSHICLLHLSLVSYAFSWLSWKYFFKSIKHKNSSFNLFYISYCMLLPVPVAARSKA